MRNQVRLSSAVMLGLTVLACVAFGADRMPVADAISVLQADLPEAQIAAEFGRVARVYGTPLTHGQSPDESAEMFVSNYAEVFGVSPDELELVGFPKSGELVLPVMFDRQTGEYKFFLYRYEQKIDGYPVFRSDLRVLVRNMPGYPTVWAGSSLQPLGDFEVPQLAAPVAIQDGVAEEAVLAAGAQTDLQGEELDVHAINLTTFTEPETVIWAGTHSKTSSDPRLAITYIGTNEEDSSALRPEHWLFVADAETGEILYTENLIRFVDVEGTVYGMATDGAGAEQCHAEVAYPMPWARVAVSGGSTSYSVLDGSFTIPNSGSTNVTVYSYIDGQRFDVTTHVGSMETLSQTVTPPGPADFMHNAANTSEYIRAQVNGYVHANLVRDWVLASSPSFPGIGSEVNSPIVVNRSDGYCPGNAWSSSADGSINFCESSSSYPNTCFQSVIAHEYGHHCIDKTSSGQGQYGEGMSDCFSLLLDDDPLLGRGFYLNQCTVGLRNADNTMQYPCSGEVHDCAELLSGCIWDTRNELIVTEPTDYLTILSELTVNSIMLHSGDMITPSITTDYLTLDDNDGDLSNGTPHYDEITTGFAAHNMWAGPPPAHDACSSAFVVEPGTYSGNTGSASNDGSASCGDSNSSADLWYSYTPAENGTLTASLCSGTSYDSVLSIHTGCPGTSSNESACDDDGCGTAGGPSTTTMGVTAGQTYLIRVTGWQGAAGAFTLTITGPPAGGRALDMSVVGTLPESIPSGDTTDVVVEILDSEESYVPGTATLHYRYDGGTYQTVTMTSLGSNQYQATLPAVACIDEPEFYFSAEGDGGTTMTLPLDAPTSSYSAVVGTLVLALDDNCESNLGWTVQNSGLTDGAWDRGVPVNCGRGDPSSDYDGEGLGQCYLTDNSSADSCNSDVDGGYTYLISPTLDLAGGGTVSYALWYDNTAGSAPNADVFKIWVSNNNGSNWTLVETVGPTSPLGWNVHTFNVADYVTPTAQVKIRFEASDLSDGSVVEAGIDTIKVWSLTCEDVDCNGDLDGNGTVNLSDLQILLASYGTLSGATCADGDMTGDGDVDLEDLQALLAVYGTNP